MHEANGQHETDINKLTSPVVNINDSARYVEIEYHTSHPDHSYRLIVYIASELGNVKHPPLKDYSLPHNQLKVSASRQLT
jgi:hypothetical protein